MTDPHDALSAVQDLRLRGAEHVVLVAYPHHTALDLAGPHHVLASMMGATVHVLSTSGQDTVPVTCGAATVATCDWDSAPSAPDLVLVPGGGVGTAAALEDRVLLDRLAALSTRAAVTASVCTGSVLLGAAGLLRGRPATSHWVTLPLLPLLGATPVDERVVDDGDLVTSAGVTAGIDLALALVARWRGTGYEATLRLDAQVDGPGSSPATADPAVLAGMSALYRPLVDRMRTALAS